jgi:Fur family ferric uptake transcriptional regulator
MTSRAAEIEPPKSRERGALHQQPSRIELLCLERGLKMTAQRRVVARVLSDSTDHPDVEEVHRRAAVLDPRISVATVYRTVRLLESQNIIERLNFGDGRARYEETTDEHHDHLIDIESGRIIEFRSAEIERLQEEIALRHGLKLVGHRHELFGVPVDTAGRRKKRNVE